jgi:hypothetical protein
MTSGSEEYIVMVTTSLYRVLSRFENSFETSLTSNQSAGKFFHCCFFSKQWQTAD